MSGNIMKILGVPTAEEQEAGAGWPLQLPADEWRSTFILSNSPMEMLLLSRLGSSCLQQTMAATLFSHLPFVNTTQALEHLEKGPRYTTWILQNVPRQGECKGRAGLDADV